MSQSFLAGARGTLKHVLGDKLTRRLKRPFVHRVSFAAVCRRTLRGSHALEIGGPSEAFGDLGCIPVYDVLKTVDNCLYAGDTIWTGEVKSSEGFIYSTSKPSGRQFICEATDLHLADTSYDCLLASHCLEHVANPIRALREWRRIL